MPAALYWASAAIAALAVLLAILPAHLRTALATDAALWLTTLTAIAAPYLLTRS